MLAHFDRRALVRGLAIVALAAALVFSRQLGGFFTRSGFAAACLEGSECRSGLCLPSRQCTEECTFGSCDEGWTCEEVSVAWRGRDGWRLRPETKYVCVPVTTERAPAAPE
jgi:hypothetical protein